MNCALRIELAQTGSELAADLERIDELWSEGLLNFGGPFLAGAEFTAADAFFAPVVFRAQTYALKLGDVAAEYVERMLEYEFMREWYEAGVREPWRDKPHEDEVSAIGTVLADYRL